MTGIEEVILLDSSGNPIGTADKASVHTSDTPLHLAFSCHVFDDAGRVLLTRRSLHKRTWPGVWTNAFCGHPAPREDVYQAVARRASHELGLTLSEVREVLPSFQYRAVDASGIVENEICPVYFATTIDAPQPRADEVAEFAWVTPGNLARAIAATPFAFSPWLVMQVAELPTYQVDAR